MTWWCLCRHLLSQSPDRWIHQRYRCHCQHCQPSHRCQLYHQGGYYQSYPLSDCCCYCHNPWGFQFLSGLGFRYWLAAPYSLKNELFHWCCWQWMWILSQMSDHPNLLSWFGLSRNPEFRGQENTWSWVRYRQWWMRCCRCLQRLRPESRWRYRRHLGLWS